MGGLKEDTSAPRMVVQVCTGSLVGGGTMGIAEIAGFPVNPADDLPDFRV